MSLASRAGTVSLLLFFCAATIASGQVNVALNRPVSLIAGIVSGEPISTLTDGLFLPREQNWQIGTVWWEGTDAIFEIDLGGTFLISSAVAQVDDNDAYVLQYHDVVTDTFLTLWDVPNFDAFGSGMQTRPNPESDAERFFFPGGPVSTDRIRISAASGDALYAASEVQVFTVPGSSGAAVLGMAGLMCLRRRR